MRQAEITCMNRWNTWLQKILSGDIIALCLTYINMNKYKVDNDLIVFSRCTQLYVTKKGCEIETTEVVALVRVRRCRFQQFHTCEWEQVAITAGNTRHHLLMKLARQQLLLWKWSTCPFEVHGNSRFLQASLKKVTLFLWKWNITDVGLSLVVVVVVGGSFVLEMYFIPAQFRSKVSNKTTV